MRSRNLFGTVDSFRRLAVARATRAILVMAFFLGPSSARAQETADTPTDEVIANLAAGRVVIAVVKDAIIIGTVENPIEAGTYPPTPVPLANRRMGIILGAVDWFSVTSQEELARLDHELPHLHRGVKTQDDPRLMQPQEGSEATDIQAIGQGVLERLNQVVKSLHNKIDLPGDEPVVEMILADYLEGYGPEIWQALFPLQQDPQRGDYWDTRVLRPHYFQFWPPEKGKPKTLVEFHYPPGDSSVTMLEMLRQNDPRMARVRQAEANLSHVADSLLAGESQKILAVDAIQFLRAALDATSPPKSRQTIAAIGLQSGFQWILPPPPEPGRPGQKKNRPEGAPTLAKPPAQP
jgi:hypothetical protein